MSTTVGKEGKTLIC
jgi:ankyrin repeat protein